MKILLTLLIFFSSLHSFAQYGNEWIDYSKNYYSFKIVEDGFYKLDYNTMYAAGIPLNSISPENFQIFGFEQEQPILVEDGGDGSFDTGDYILFYAKKNTTWLDSLLYDEPENVGNKYYPHYNDTITYFVSWNNLNTNNRIQVETDNNYGNYTPRNFLLKKSYKEYHNTYVYGQKIEGISFSSFIEGEGWTSNGVNALSGSGQFNSQIATPYSYSGVSAPNVIGEAVSMSISNAPNGTSIYNHHLQLQYGASNTVLHDIEFSGYKKNNLAISFPASDITGNTTLIRHQLINDLGLASDYQAIAFVELIYPHSLNAEGLTKINFISSNNPSDSKSLYNITNFNSPTPLAFSFGDQLKKLPITNNILGFQVIVPNSTQNQQELKLLDESEIMTIPNIKPVNGNGIFTDFSNLNYNSAYIIVSNKILSNSVDNYKAYRSSAAGGSKNVIIAYSDELNLQFGGGVPKHIMGVRRFQHFAFNMATTEKPEHVFIIGKGVREASENILQNTHGIRKSTFAYNMCLVPTFGFPASDNSITNHIQNNDWAPLISIGRLAANSNGEVETYLSKVKEFETAQNPSAPYLLDTKYWQKNILHFGGGNTTGEQTTFRAYLDNFKVTLEGPDYAGHVTSFHKYNSDPINPVTLYEVTDKINEGVSLMTFFGHAYPGGFDQNVDDPDTWNNKGKYPVLISNSCLAGNIQEPNLLSVSEEFVLIDSKGSIAFLASVGNAFSTGLYAYTNRLMSNIANENYGKSIGELIKLSIEQLQPTNSFSLVTAMSQMTLHGDPALKVNPHNKPELEINVSDFKISPNVVDLSLDSINVSIIIHNMGISTLDTFAIELKRSFPNNGGDSTYIKFVNGIHYNDTVVFRIPFIPNQSGGINNFSISVDQPSIISEQYDEINNNQITKQVLFDIGGIYPVWPYDYAVVPDDTITLKASSINPFASLDTYRFEIDTTDLFNSPELRYSMPTSLGGVIDVNYDNWLLSTDNSSSNLVLEDSTVYFWRTKLNSSPNSTWHESSFQYIKNKTGWGQDHFFQFKNNTFNALNYNRPTRDLTYSPAGVSIACDVFGNAVVPQVYYTQWEIAGSLQEYGICTYNPSFMVCVVDAQTLNAWSTRYFNVGTGIMENPNNDFGNANDNGGCRNRPEKYFIFFQNDSLQMADMQDMLINDIPDSNYVLIYTSRFLNYPEWDAHNPELYPFFQNLGSDSIYAGQQNVPYICFYKKGAESTTFEEVYPDNINDYIRFDGYMFGYDYNGFETSTIIGPAQEWESVFWDQYSVESTSTDTTQLKIFGVDLNGTETLLVDTLFTVNDSITNFNTLFSADDYPYLRLQSQHIDTINYTPSQLARWHVLYQPVPEAALTSVNGYYISTTDTINEGESLAFAFDITNISELPMDSILVNYWIENDENEIIPISYPRQDSLRVGQIIRDTLQIQSLGLKNLNSLWVEINPYINPENTITDQLEQYHFNNIGQIPFYVNADNENPILDVTFNGYHILNGDIVNSKSEVVITLKDENDYLIMSEESDTSSFGIYLTDPNGFQKRLNFRNDMGEQLMEWIPADASSKKFKIIFSGDFALDGTYRLLVQGADKSGNLSGDYSYDIEFEIDHNSSITNLMNYPNPFSTQTQFVFTLTGDVIPDEFTIQVLTISGKVIREITVDELGPIHIGRNITEYKWDGKDEFGDRLANGIYLYKVITKINGETIEHRESGADNFISNGFGKMYLIH